MNKERFLRNFMKEIWNEQQFEKIAFYVHENYTIHLDTADPWEGQTLSHETFKERLKFSFNSFPDMNFDITSAIEEENHVAITWILTGTNLGGIANFPPTHRKIKTTGITIYHFTNERISGHTQIFDRIKVAQQLGFM